MAENVRVIKDRIGNIGNIRQITKAMNAIAMTKVTRMKRRVAAVRPYVEGFDTLVAEILAQSIGTGEPRAADLHAAELVFPRRLRVARGSGHRTLAAAAARPGAVM